MDMDISMDIHAKSVDMDMDMDGKFHIHGNPDKVSEFRTDRSWVCKSKQFLNASKTPLPHRKTFKKSPA